MDEMLTTLFGKGKELNILQMGCRGFIMFFITLGMIWISGIRTFGTRSAFDNVIVIMLGAILSRAVVGASPFFPIVAASLVLCIIHRLLALISIHSQTVSHLLKGKECLLYKDGKFLNENMRKCHITMGDLMGQLRLQANTSSLDNIREISFERNGEISVVKSNE